MTQSPQTNAKGFSKAFWVSNTVELFERMAYYAVFIVLTIYLSNILGFNDFEASMISGLFIIRKSKCSRVSKRKVHFTKRSV